MLWTAAKYTLYAVYSPVILCVGAAVVGALEQATYSALAKGTQHCKDLHEWVSTCNCRVCTHRRSLGLNTFH